MENNKIYIIDVYKTSEQDTYVNGMVENTYQEHGNIFSFEAAIEDIKDELKNYGVYTKDFNFEYDSLYCSQYEVASDYYDMSQKDNFEKFKNNKIIAYYCVYELIIKEVTDVTKDIYKQLTGE